jgi:hypothetical protein
MLDIDFLSAARPSLRQHAVYTYSSGLLRGPVRIRLNQLYRAKGMICGEASPDNPLSSVYLPSLLGAEAIFIDTARYDNISTVLPVLMPDLETNAVSNSVIFFAPEGATFLQTPSWLAFAKTATVLEEARLSKSAMPKLVAFFGLQSRVFDYRQLTNKADLLAALQETLKSESNWTLVEFQERLEFLAVMCVVEQTFDKVLFRKYAPPSSKEDSYKFHKAVFEFLLAKTEEKLIPVLQLFSQEYVVQPNARLLFGLLRKITRDILAVNLELNPKGQAPKDWSAYKKAKLMAYKGLPLVNLFKWSITLAREEPHFSQKNFVVALHDLCYFYMESFDAPLDE